MTPPTKERRAELVDARRQRGLCLYCYEQVVKGYSVCEYHLERRRSYGRKWANKQAVKSQPAEVNPDVLFSGCEWYLTFSIDCPTVWTIAGEQK